MTRPAFRLERLENDDAVRVRIDLEHRFYFDHPLGHLPGLLLLDAALGAVESRAQRALGCGAVWTTRLEIAFKAMSMLEEPLLGKVRQRGANRFACVLTQAGKPRVELEAELAPLVAEVDTCAPAATRPFEVVAPFHRFLPVDQSLVRKALPENVFLGVRDDEILRPIRRPRDVASALMAERHGHYRPVYLAECLLQLARMSRQERSAPGSPVPASREVLIQIGLQLPRPIPATASLEIGAWPEAAAGLFPRHPRSQRRNAGIFQGQQIIGSAFCDAVKL